MEIINSAKYEDMMNFLRICATNSIQLCEKRSPSNTDVNKFTPIIDNDKNQLIYSKYYGNTYHKLSFNHKINSMFSLYRKRNITEIMFWSHYKI
jgi:hypothetical protein